MVKVKYELTFLFYVIYCKFQGFFFPFYEQILRKVWTSEYDYFPVSALPLDDKYVIQCKKFRVKG